MSPLTYRSSTSTLVFPASLMTFFFFLEPYIPHNTPISLPEGHKLLIVLVKLRRNFPVQDLAYRFGISRATVSRTFLAEMRVMFVRLQRYMYWPEHEELRRTMPMEFCKYYGVTVLTFSSRHPPVQMLATFIFYCIACDVSSFTTLYLLARA